MTAKPSDELTLDGLARLGPANQCDAEAIGRSEAVQPHGVLLGIEPGTLRVEVVSANLAEMLGVAPDQALGRPLEEVLGPDGTRVVAGLREVSRLDDVNPLAISVPGRPGGPQPAATAFDLVAHRADGLLIVELEARELGDRRDADLVEFYELFRLALTRLRGIDDVQGLCEVGVEQLRLLAGYDRVMAYRFDADATGQIIAEASADGAYLGLTFPAGDIPRQARALYLRNWFRQIADVERQPVPLRRLGPAAGRPVEPLDLSLASLRSIAPAHLQYLQNMGVRASASVSLIVEDQLWGLLTCHHHTPRWIPPHVRVACETLGRLLSLQLGGAQNRSYAARAERLTALSAQVERALADSAVLAEGAARAPEALLGLVEADSVVLRLDGTIVALGATPPPVELTALVSAVTGLAGDHPWHTDRLAEHIPGHDPRSSGAAGALYLPLGAPGGDFVLWLRAERLKSVTWGGRSTDKRTGADPAAAITPRSSFAPWHEVVSGTSPPWTPVELEAAAAFGHAVPQIQLRRTQRQLAHLALHDSLTGLPNRTMFLDRLGHALARSDALGRTALMFIDIDKFKLVNDTLGHQAGDAMLGEAAARLRSGIRDTDTAGRMGGDEFVVLCEDLNQPRDALDIATRIVEEFRRPFVLGGTEWRVTASVGLTMFEAGPDGTEFLRQADLALYQAKQVGRDQVVVFDRQLSDSFQLAIRTERDLADAVRLGELVVHYQPVFDLRPDPDDHPPTLPASTPYGVEALIRWQHPTRGLLSPAEFLSYAEGNALGDAIGDHVLTLVLDQLTSWRRNIPAAESLRVAVNVTVRQLTAPRFAERIIEQLAAHGVPASRFSLELTETQLMSDPCRTIGAMRDLDAAGVQVAIDDFGTGFSSLAYVRDLPARSLKVDRSFVVGLPGDTRDVAVVTAVIGLAHELGMTTIAEGVETPEQLDCLRQLGCDFAQGFLLGRPVPAAELQLDT